MLLTDSKPILYQSEKCDIKIMMERIQLGIGQATDNTGTQENVDFTMLIEDSKRLR